MDDNKITKLKIEQKVEQETPKTNTKAKLQTNPILQKMLTCNESSQKMKFKLKDLFR